ncbi:FAD-dependent oxidoreductase [Thalassotalea marina]|uniref:Monooxygenase n=1 Tax=Thalassotalea marina TaxID=1673741 RepID=A0A919ENN6_9GAMM|nr:FAD-dependent oxidoreductase [Thalassotalea marina]GHG02957.1 monooxygenase [Thalassotalea marina]
MSQLKDIAIIGAGVAGLALAIFARKQGITVTIYERNQEISTIGAGITLWPNAIFVIKQLGVLATIEELSGKPEFIRQFDQFFTMQGELDIKEINEHCQLPSLTILRRDLMKVLAERANALGAEFKFDHQIEQHDIDGLMQTHDLVIGCDGRMKSASRDKLFENKPLPVYQGFINIIGISQLANEQLDHAIEDYRGQQQRFGIVPIKSGLCYWAAAWPASLDKKRPVDDWYHEMHQRFQHWPNQVKQVLSSYNINSLNRIFVHDIDPLPYWHKSNLIVIGDAAHAPLPTSGQGACQALEDAWHLMQTLTTDALLDDQLTSFYQQRIAKVTAAQMAGRSVAKHIFSTTEQPSVSFSNISAEQLSSLWMQGLVSKPEVNR